MTLLWANNLGSFLFCLANWVYNLNWFIFSLFSFLTARFDVYFWTRFESRYGIWVWRFDFKDNVTEVVLQYFTFNSCFYCGLYGESIFLTTKSETRYDSLTEATTDQLSDFFLFYFKSRVRLVKTGWTTCWLIAITPFQNLLQ